MTDTHIEPGTPTQVAHPWRAVARTIFQALVAICALLPAIVEAVGVGAVPWVAGALAVAGAITRVMTVPGVEEWIARYLPFLATGVHTEETTDII